MSTGASRREKKRGHWALLVGLSLALVWVVPAEAKKGGKGGARLKLKKKAKTPKSPHKLGFGVQTGSGIDSNMLSSPKNATVGGIAELGLKGKYGYRATKAIKLSTGVKFDTSYRHATEETNALKLKLGARPGFRWKLFGSGARKLSYRPTGILGASFAYSGTFNPVLNKAEPFQPEPPPPDPTLEENEEFVEDLVEDEVAEDEEEDESDDDLGDDDEEEEEAEAEEDAEDDFFEADPVGSKMFSSKPARHVMAGNVLFSLAPWRDTTFRLTSKAGYGDVGETEGKPSPDYQQFGGALKLQQKLLKKRLTLKAGYALDARLFTEKTVPNLDEPGGEPYSMRTISHAWSFGGRVLPHKRFKIDAMYRFGMRRVPHYHQIDSQLHQASLGFEFKLLKALRIFQANSLLFSAVQGNPEKPGSEKETTRYQGLLGVRYVQL